jgi:hypothetical protein
MDLRTCISKVSAFRGVAIWGPHALVDGVRGAPPAISSCVRPGEDLEPLQFALTLQGHLQDPGEGRSHCNMPYPGLPRRRLTAWQPRDTCHFGLT